jgi:2,5-dihydroxypyridine 5,6-dioxygenase
VRAARNFQTVDMFVPIITISLLGLMLNAGFNALRARLLVGFPRELRIRDAGRPDRGKWIDAFCEIFEKCAVKAGDTAAILSETPVARAQCAARRACADAPRRAAVPPRGADAAQPHPVPVALDRRERAIGGLAPVVSALGQAGFVVDCTLEGLMHAPETPEFSRAGDASWSSRTSIRGARAHAARSRHSRTLVCGRRAENAARRQAHGVARRAGTKLDIDMAGSDDGRRLGTGPTAGNLATGRAASW